MRRIVSSMLCPLILVTLAATAPAAEKESALEREIRLDLWGKHLGDAVSQITERASLDVVVDPRFVRPKDFAKHPLYLEASGIPARTAVEWLARALGCRYRVTGPHSVLLTGSYSWMKEDRKLCIPRFSLDSLIAPGESTRTLERNLWELVKVNSLLGRNFYLRIEVDRVSETERTRQLVATLPQTLKDYLDQALKAMTAPGQSLKDVEAPGLDAEAAALVARLRNPVVVRYKDAPLRDVLREIALQSGVSIGFDHKPFAGNPPAKITLALGKVSVREAIEKLTEALGLGGQELMPPAFVWLTAEKRAWTPAGTRAFLWDNMTVRSYAVKSLGAALGGGEVLPHHIRHNVATDTWRDPASAVVYHRKSGNLIVLAPPATQRAVSRELVRLRKAWEARSAADSRP